MPYISLIPCPACARHVRSCDARCPFCSEALPAWFRDVVHAEPAQRLNRGAQHHVRAAVVAAVAVGLTACNEPAAPTPLALPAADHAVAAPIAPPPAADAATPVADAAIGGADAATPHVAAVVDAGAHASHRRPVHHGGPHDNGAVRALYGVPFEPREAP